MLFSRQYYMFLKSLEVNGMIKENRLVDSFARPHSYLRISLTERCNLRCFYCMPEDGVSLLPKDNYMTADEIFSIAKVFVSMGVTKIRLTGGEPLVRKDADTIIRKLASLPVELCLTTNAILVDRFIPLFKEVGLKKVNVSLDSLDKDKNEKIVKRDYFERIMNNIRLLQDNQIHPKMNVVLMNGINDDEIIDFVKWTEHTPLDIRFIEFMPFNGNQWELEKCVPDDLVLEKLRLHFGMDELISLGCEDHYTARDYKIRGFAGKFGLISTVTKPFCSTCNRLRLTADGKLKNCLFSTSETDLLTAFRRGEDIKALISDNVMSKKKMRGGMEDMNDSISEIAESNRSMIRIGG